MTQMAQRWQLLSPWWRWAYLLAQVSGRAVPVGYSLCLTLPPSDSTGAGSASYPHYILAPQIHWQSFPEGQNSHTDLAPNMLKHEQALVWCLSDDWERAGRRRWDSDCSCHWALCFVGDCTTSLSWRPYFSHLSNDTDINWPWVGKAGDEGM